MRLLIAYLSACILSSLTPRAFAQGTVAFDTFISGKIDAKATFPDGTAVNGYTGQVYATLAGQPLSSLSQVLPVALVKQGYIHGSQLYVPGISPTEFATLQVRVYNGSSWEASTSRGESLPITIQLNGDLEPPAELIGLQPFVVTEVPEPTTLLLLLISGALLCYFRLRQSAV